MIFRTIILIAILVAMLAWSAFFVGRRN